MVVAAFVCHTEWYRLTKEEDEHDIEAIALELPILLKVCGDMSFFQRAYLY